MQYDRFAPYYDNFAIANSAGFIKEIADKYFPKASTLLDLACGTGNDLAELQNYYSCTGLDQSENMLTIAHLKTNSALHQADMREFDLGKTFDIIICMFDSINHLSSLEKIKQTLKCVKKHMHEKSIFIFDINTYAYLESLGDGYDFFLQKDVQMSLIPDESFVKWQVLKNNELLEEIHEYFYSLQDIKSIVSSYFTYQLIDGNKQEPTEQTHRIFFICQNP